MLKVGDRVITIQPKILTSGQTLFHKDIRFYINGVMQTKCKCGPWNLVWLGITSKDKFTTTCTGCNEVVISDYKMWVKDSYVSKISIWEDDVNNMGRLNLQMCLLKMLVNKQVDNIGYDKIMSMLEGDDELLELGKQLIKKIKDDGV